MTGWRVGYVHSDARNVREILKVHDALVTCAPVVSQYGAIAALEYGDTHVAAFRNAFKERRDRTVQHLDTLSHIFDYQKPEGAYFVFPRVKDIVPRARDSRRLAFHILEQAKVALVPGVCALSLGIGEAAPAFNFGRELADIDTAFERLQHYFRQQLPFAGRSPKPLPLALSPEADTGHFSNDTRRKDATSSGVQQPGTYSGLLASFYEENNRWSLLSLAIAARPW
jgi:hypothetical protein